MVATARWRDHSRQRRPERALGGAREEGGSRRSLEGPRGGPGWVENKLREPGHRWRLPAQALDADQFLATDGHFGAASPLQIVAERTISAALRPVLDGGAVAVVTGFCGQAPDGATTTLGRGGSDYSATLVAAALGADEVTIWTDVPGVYSANPKIVSDARVIDQLHYREAGELSYYGAKVLHQRTMIPVARAGIPVRTRSSFAPHLPGTTVDGRRCFGLSTRDQRVDWSCSSTSRSPVNTSKSMTPKEYRSAR